MCAAADRIGFGVALMFWKLIKQHWRNRHTCWNLPLLLYALYLNSCTQPNEIISWCRWLVKVCMNVCICTMYIEVVHIIVVVKFCWKILEKILKDQIFCECDESIFILSSSQTFNVHPLWSLTFWPEQCTFYAMTKF